MSNVEAWRRKYTIISDDNRMSIRILSAAQRTVRCNFVIWAAIEVSIVFNICWFDYFTFEPSKVERTSAGSSYLLAAQRLIISFHHRNNNVRLVCRAKFTRELETCGCRIKMFRFRIQFPGRRLQSKRFPFIVLIKNRNKISIYWHRQSQHVFFSLCLVKFTHRTSGKTMEYFVWPSFFCLCGVRAYCVVNVDQFECELCGHTMRFSRISQYFHIRKHLDDGANVLLLHYQ